MVDPAHLVGIGGTLGAILRYTVSQLLETEQFPLSTFIVNVLGSFILGAVVFADTGESVVLFIGVGFCGAFTTFSTFSVDTVRLWEDGYPQLAVIYALGNIVVSIIAVGLAWVLVA